MDEKNLTITFTLIKSLWNHLSQSAPSAVFDSIQTSSVLPVLAILKLILAETLLAHVKGLSQTSLPLPGKTIFELILSKARFTSIKSSSLKIPFLIVHSSAVFPAEAVLIFVLTIALLRLLKEKSSLLSNGEG